MIDDKISIIVPTYNSEDSIEKCISSLINQTYINIEIIIVDDGSTDNTQKICKSLCENDSRIKYIKKENGGVSSARNTGIDNSTGNYIFFVDSDDFIDIDLLEKLYMKLEGNQIAKASFKIFNNGKKCKINLFSKTYDKDEFIRNIIAGNVGGHSWGYLISKKLIEDTRFDENTSHMEDTLFIIKCIENVNVIPCINNSFYNHNINYNGITCSKDKIYDSISEYIYSLNQINVNLKYKYNNEIEVKKYILIEKEMAKISSVSECKDIIQKANKDNLMSFEGSKASNLYYKLFLELLKNERYIKIFCVIKIRNLVKKFIKGV